MKKLLNKINKITALCCVLALVVMVAVANSKSNVKATSYVYDFWKNIIPSSEGITYKETYYNKDIKYVNDSNISLPDFSNLTDMEVYGGKIYVLDYSPQTFSVPAEEKPVTIETMGSIIVINQDFQYEEIYNEFLITDEVKAKFDDFYKFSTPLEKITNAQIKSTEFVDIYDGKQENGVVENGQVKFGNFKYASATDKEKAGLSFELYDMTDSSKPVLISDEYYTTEVKTEKVKVTVTTAEGKVEEREEERSYTIVTLENVSDGTNVYAKLITLNTPGRAPYVPYSQDPTKAAVRLNTPNGITVNDKYIFVADTENLRILKINKETLVVEDVYLSPSDSSFYQLYNASYETPFGTAYETIKVTTDFYTTVHNDKIFKPTKVAINNSGVCYCIVKDVYEGLVEFGANTEFNRYVGKNVVTADALKKLWSNIWSEAQYASQALDLPAMFNNISVSPDGFLYATSNPDGEATQAQNLVKIINTKGNDIMKRNGYVTPDGDAVYITTTKEDNVILGPSVLTSVCISKTGNFTVTDEKRGRLFTYDSEGNLLYITGDQPGGTSTTAQGGLSNSIIKPIASDYLYRLNNDNVEEETVIVLDGSSKSIMLFETTEFGKAVNTATYLYQTGQIEDQISVDDNGNEIIVPGAESYWREVIRMNTNYELAYLGIGKALNRRGEYKEAMKYFELAHNAVYYSKAFSSYRDQVLNANFDLIMAVVCVVAAGYVVLKVTTYINKKNLENAKREEGGMSK